MERDIQPGDAERIMELARNIMSQPIEMIEGVPETLEYLAMRHDLTLFTKGHPEEQKLKVDRSGLGHLFRPHGDRQGEGSLQLTGRLFDERRLDPRAPGWSGIPRNRT